MTIIKNIICLLWKGDFRGRDYRDEDVNRLGAMIKRSMGSTPYRFYCLTNDPDAELDAIKIPLIHNWPGWWSKVELFRPDLPIEGENSLYLDLDITIVGDLNKLWSWDKQNRFVLFDTKHPNPKRTDKIDGLVRKYQASVMKIPSTSLKIYEKFVMMPQLYLAQYRSEQDMYGAWFPHQPCWPPNWLMKIGTAVRTKAKPKDLIIISGHSKNNDFRKTGVKWIDRATNQR